MKKTLHTKLKDTLSMMGDVFLIGLALAFAFKITSLIVP